MSGDTFVFVFGGGGAVALTFLVEGLLSHLDNKRDAR